MQLEVCVDSLESATNAVYNGADELEVCSTLSNGGLTPVYNLVKQIIDMIDLYVTTQNISKKPKVNVMIRCREGWDFCYNDHEINVMSREIKDFKSLNVDRFVFGALTKDRDVDVNTCKQILELARPTPMTFHRAFDHCKNPRRAIEDIIYLGFSRLLTSGLSKSVADRKATELIYELNKEFGDKIEVMPGAGVTDKNAEIFKHLGCKIIHGTFKKQRLYSSTELVYVTDGEIVRKVKQIINS